MRLPAKLHYAWVVAAVTFVALLLTAGVRAAPGILIVPLETEFHWARSTISFAVGVNLLLYGLIGPFAAALIDRFGVRRTMAVALAVTAAAVALTPAMRQSWQLILLSLFSVFYGLDWIAGVPPTVRLLSRVVGTERTGIMVAWITVIHQVGGASAAYLGGVLRISFGTYLEAFLFAGLLCFAAAAMALSIGVGGRRAEPAPDAVPAG